MANLMPTIKRLSLTHQTKGMTPFTKAIESCCPSRERSRRTGASRASILTSTDTSRCTRLKLVRRCKSTNQSISKWQTLTQRCKSKSTKSQGPWSRKSMKRLSVRTNFQAMLKAPNHLRYRNSMSRQKGSNLRKLLWIVKRLNQVRRRN